MALTNKNISYKQLFFVASSWQEDGEEVEEESEQTGFEIFSEFNETCWAQDLPGGVLSPMG